MLMTSKVAHVALKSLSFKLSKIMESRKAWQLEVTCTELTILQIALRRFMDKYEGEVFEQHELQSTMEELWTYKYISQIKNGSL